MRSKIKRPNYFSIDVGEFDGVKYHTLCRRIKKKKHCKLNESFFGLSFFLLKSFLLLNGAIRSFYLLERTQLLRRQVNTLWKKENH